MTWLLFGDKHNIITFIYYNQLLSSIHHNLNSYHDLHILALLEEQLSNFYTVNTYFKTFLKYVIFH